MTVSGCMHTVGIRLLTLSVLSLLPIGCAQNSTTGAMAPSTPAPIEVSQLAAPSLPMLDTVAGQLLEMARQVIMANQRLAATDIADSVPPARVAVLRERWRESLREWDDTIASVAATLSESYAIGSDTAIQVAQAAGQDSLRHILSVLNGLLSASDETTALVVLSEAERFADFRWLARAIHIECVGEPEVPWRALTAESEIPAGTPNRDGETVVVWGVLSETQGSNGTQEYVLTRRPIQPYSGRPPDFEGIIIDAQALAATELENALSWSFILLTGEMGMGTHIEHQGYKVSRFRIRAQQVEPLE